MNINQRLYVHCARRYFVDISQPLDDVLEALLVRDVVNEHDPHCPSVVRSGDCVKPLLAGGVPYLELDLLPFQVHRFDFEIYACKRERLNLPLTRGLTFRK